MTPVDPSHPRRAAWVCLLVYLCVAVALTGTVALRPGSALVGLPTVDAFDTAMLRGLFLGLLEDGSTWPVSTGIYFPIGFPVGHLMPNVLDHLTAAPLVALLPFPLSDNLWWWLVLALDGICGHRLGRRIGGSEGAGLLAGLGLMLSEAVLREANLHHAPQAMLFWAPLYLDALLGLRASAGPSAAGTPTGGDAWVQTGDRQAVLAGLWLAMGALTYWYLGMFLVFATVPLLVGLRWRHLVLGGGVVLVCCVPFLLPQLLAWDDRPLTAGGVTPPPAKAPPSFDVLPEKERFVAQHGVDLLFPFRRTPIDLTNRVSLVLLVAAFLGARRTPGPLRWRLGFVAGLGAVMVLGPYLRWGDELVVVADHAIPLPFEWLRRVHPFLARLTWPERWGLLIPLGLVALAARAPRPGWWALGIVIEAVVLSPNLPLDHVELRHRTCWAQLEGTTGAVLELPLKRGGLMAPRVGVHQRMYRRPTVNPVLLPPGAVPPEAWPEWVEAQPLLQYLKDYEAGRWPDAPASDAADALRDAGVSVIALDAEPGALLRPSALARLRTGITRHLGPPIDLGCAVVWWLDEDLAPPAGLADGDAWRAEALEWKRDNVKEEVDSLIRPVRDRFPRTAPGGG